MAPVHGVDVVVNIVCYCFFRVTVLLATSILFTMTATWQLSGELMKKLHILWDGNIYALFTQINL